MSLRFRHLRLRAITADGIFGADLRLPNGLVVLRADNSRGKSTAIQSLLYGLGLERMITSRPAQTLTAAMRDRLIYDEATMAEAAVLESSVTLDIEGAGGREAAVTRWVKHPEFNPSLVRVAEGPVDTRGEAIDYFVGRPGAASHGRGFHRWLADFIGWELPTLVGPDGRETPLYMEQVFPLLFVEQRRGWGGIQAQMPMFSGVPDVRRRAIEFLLDLDVGRLDAERRRLRAEEARVQAEWRVAVRAFRDALAGTGLVAINLADSISLTWPSDPPASVVEGREGDWIPIELAIQQLRQRVADIRSTPIPTVEQEVPGARVRLAEADDSLTRARQAAGLLAEEIDRDRVGLRSVDERLQALREDLQQHSDLVTLRRLGSAAMSDLEGDCPVCHQRLPDSLLSTDLPVAAMSPEAAVAYLRMQIELFDAMAGEGRNTISAKEEKLTALKDREFEIRTQIRTLRSTLTSAGQAPSESAIAERVRLDDRLERLRAIYERYLGLSAALAESADEARNIRGRLQELPTDRLSEADATKLALLERSFVDQLTEYDFGSFSDENLRISSDDFLPRREEFDLQADISASDSIRVIWAYLIGLLEVSRAAKTNHPGMVVFDEPRQQSAKEVSFAALLDRASRASTGRQIVFATSEDLASLSPMVDRLPSAELQVIDGYLLKRVD